MESIKGRHFRCTKITKHLEIPSDAGGSHQLPTTEQSSQISEPSPKYFPYSFMLIPSTKTAVRIRDVYIALMGGYGVGKTSFAMAAAGTYRARIGMDLQSCKYYSGCLNSLTSFYSDLQDRC